MSDLWSVVIGGALTIVGGGSVQVLRDRTASLQRKQDRETAQREGTRADLDALQIAAARYQGVFRRYERALAAPDAVPANLDDELAEVRADFQRLTFRTAGRVREAMLAWERAALSWSQGDGSAHVEAQRWEEAMKASGQAIQDNR